MEEAAVSLAAFLGVNGAFSLSSDLCAQALERRPEVDWRRAGAFTASGVAFSGLSQFARHYCIDVMFPAGGELWVAAGKTAVNQLVFAPTLRAASMGSVQYLQSQSWEDVKDRIKADFWEAQGVSYLVKPAANFVAFAVFPSNLVGQAVVLRVCGFGYNIYYSYILNRAVPKGADNDAEGDERAPDRVMSAKGSSTSASAPPPPTPPAPARVPDLRVYLRSRQRTVVLEEAAEVRPARTCCFDISSFLGREIGALRRLAVGGGGSKRR
eukprot:TRINITY_DN641_c4_g1_i1.p2 TRINITY_DN641_c4_g1~~TRINITY_DN641_c4_g1_i1.p2  ORF type:complete len:268 (+),score=85.70 TRINITY_DN641_c4_g1_i1:217-1020(+)